jgi:ligand-binding sensor domain-containing protein
VQLGSINNVYGLDVDSHNVLWAATNEGLFRWSDGQLNVMDLKNGLPCSKIDAFIQDDQGSHWLRADCGILRIAADEWERWQNFSESRVSFVMFDALDGARSALGLGNQPQVTKSCDGRLWFAANVSVQMIDPKRSSNLVPPPVHIEEVVADHKTYESLDKVAVPHLRGELEIYSALSFKIPQRVLFRYKLEGHDEGGKKPARGVRLFTTTFRQENIAFE